MPRRREVEYNLVKDIDTDLNQPDWQHYTAAGGSVHFRARVFGVVRLGTDRDFEIELYLGGGKNKFTILNS